MMKCIMVCETGGNVRIYPILLVTKVLCRFADFKHHSSPFPRHPSTTSTVSRVYQSLLPYSLLVAVLHVGTAS